jgi:hypothetical protein
MNSVQFEFLKEHGIAIAKASAERLPYLIEENNWEGVLDAVARLKDVADVQIRLGRAKYIVGIWGLIPHRVIGDSFEEVQAKNPRTRIDGAPVSPGKLKLEPRNHYVSSHNNGHWTIVTEEKMKDLKESDPDCYYRMWA